jgi:hypothetical protein
MAQDRGKLAVSLVFLACGALAASDDVAIQSTFVKPWIEALRSKDQARIEQFYHPAVRACMNPSTKDFFDFVLDRETDSATGGAYRIAKLAPMQGLPPALLPESGFTYPVRPTYEIQVDFDHGELTIRFLAPSNGSWYEVYPCPNEKGTAYFRKQLAEAAGQERKAAQLVATLKDPLRSELKDLPRHRQKFQAIQEIRDATGVDLSMAMRVMDLLEQK